MIAPARSVCPTDSPSTLVDEFLAEHPYLETPFLVLDHAVVARRYRELTAALPDTVVYYAVKANPDPRVLHELAAAGASFDVASPGEIAACLALGIEAHRLSYGNTIKKERDIASAYRAGVRTFTVDAPAELDKVIRSAPTGLLFVRIDTDGGGSDWPLSGKFGCPTAEAERLLVRAARHGYAVGVSFHVGSQQRSPAAWDAPLAEIGALYDRLRRQGVEPAAVNLGGGLPSTYVDPVAGLDEYAGAIRASVRRRLGPGFAGQVVIEPGRYLVGDAGLLRAEVVLISDRPAPPGHRWVYLDVGMFNGLAESLGEAIRYRVRPARSRPVGAATGPVVLAGPSCDSVDVLYEKYAYQLPLDLAVGDRIDFLATGAYTASYSSVGFNGFPPLRTYVV